MAMLVHSPGLALALVTLFLTTAVSAQTPSAFAEAQTLANWSIGLSSAAAGLILIAVGVSVYQCQEKKKKKKHSKRSKRMQAVAAYADSNSVELGV
jgi:predicted permease